MDDIEYDDVMCMPVRLYLDYGPMVWSDGEWQSVCNSELYENEEETNERQ